MTSIHNIELKHDLEFRPYIQPTSTKTKRLARHEVQEKSWWDSSWHWEFLGITKVGPVPVISKVITPLVGIITPVTHLFSAIYNGYL